MMPRFRRPTREEVSERRAALAARAKSGELHLPGAVAEMRHALGLSQEEFARILKLGRRQIAEIERGEANPTIETLSKIGRIFGMGIGFVPARKPTRALEVRKARPLAPPHREESEAAGQDTPESAPLQP